MQRIIKFRVWHVDKKSFVKGLTYCIDDFSTTNKEWHILSQFTGLHDKYKKEIYEGDIVKVDYGIGVVEYSEKQAMFVIRWIDDPESYNESLAYEPNKYKIGETRKDLEIIGNIYKNHELLK